MPVPLTYFVGDTQGGLATDFWPDGYSWDLTVFEQNKPARSGDVTLIEQNEWIKLRDHIRQLLTSGFTKLGAFITGNYFSGGISTPMPANSFAMGESWFNNTGQSVHVGNPDSAIDGNPNAVFVQLPAPPTSGTANDLVYLEVWVQEVGAVGSTDTGGTNIVDRNVYKWGGIGNGVFSNTLYWNGPSGPVEPVRRLQLRWAFRVARNAASIAAATPQGGALSQQGSYAYTLYESFPDGNNVTQNVLYRAGDGSHAAGQALNAVDGYVWATPIAIVARTGGVTNITISVVNDRRSVSYITTNVYVNVQNVIPPPAGGSDPLLHLAPATFVYQGAAIASYTTTQLVTLGGTTQSTDLSAQSEAVRFACPDLSNGVLLPELAGLTTYQLAYATFTLSKAGTGADVTVELHADAGTAPGTLISSTQIPASWLTASPRSIGVCFALNSSMLTKGANYWLVVVKGGTATNHAVLSTGTRQDGSGNFVSSPDGSTWTATNVLPYAAYAGTLGDIVFVRENANDLFYFEYDVNGNISAIGELYAYGATGRFDAYRLVAMNATTGAVVGIA